VLRRRKYTASGKLFKLQLERSEITQSLFLIVHPLRIEGYFVAAFDTFSFIKN
jgi:hypothetical protein